MPAPLSRIAFLGADVFASVAANAIATTARNPVSGMTMLTIIISSVVLLRFGVSGPTGMFFVMALAGMVCTALSTSGQFITDLKTGYWLGSTPAEQQKVKAISKEPAVIAERTGLPAYTPNTLTTLERLSAELETIRHAQLAYDREEAELGVACIGAPVRDAEGKLVAGLSISAPARASADDGVPSRRRTPNG